MESIFTHGAPPALGPYSQAIRAGDTVYCSGQVPLDPSGGIVAGDVTAQAQRVLENLRAVLAAAGCDFSHVVKTTVFLVDMDDYAAVNAAYAAAFGDAKPARSTVAVSALPRGARVEIDCVALLRLG